METVVRDVSDLNVNERAALERVVGHQLTESQRLVIQVISVPVAHPEPTRTSGSAELPEWCDVYEGLTAEKVDEIDSSIVRSHTSRDAD